MYVKLKAWAKYRGVSYRTALRWFHDGQIPNAEQMPSGTILVLEADKEEADSK